jgi:ribose transport system permease protein
MQLPRGKMPKINLSSLKKYTVMLVLAILVILFSFTSPYFLTFRNLTNIIGQNTYFIIVAIGLSFVMIGGGIDLSVGYQMSLVGVVTAMMMVVYQLPVWLAVALGLLLGTILGLLNGLIVSSIKVFPLIVTLATSIVFRGLSFIISQAKTFRSYPETFLALARGKVLGMPFDVFLTLVIAVIVSIVYYETVFGYRLVALGGNPEASRLSGMNIRKMRVTLYTLCGFFTAIGTMIMISKANTTHSSFGPGIEFTVLTAAIVGGISFKGGEGNIPALVAGVFILAVLGNGMQLAGWGTYAQFIIQGLILLAAVAFDEYQRNSKNTTQKC